MKKILSVVLLGLLLNSPVLAVTTNIKSSATTNVTGSDNQVKNWMKTRNGKVSVFDIQVHVAIINKKTYNLASDLKIYDGMPVKGNRVKFNLNEKNNITEVWIIKK